jgi:hypothetical protein
MTNLPLPVERIQAAVEHALCTLAQPTPQAERHDWRTSATQHNGAEMPDTLTGLDDRRCLRRRDPERSASVWESASRLQE